MGAVGFLTFGFTEAVCPTPPLSFHVADLNKGYISIDGWAYMLASWSDHPPIPGVTSTHSNIMYEPISAGGMDATFFKR
jgi:chitin synthase